VVHPETEGRFGPLIEHFRALTAETPVATLLVWSGIDGSATILAANAASERLLLHEGLLGLDVATLVAGTQLPMEQEAVRRSADGRIDVVARVRPYRRGDGSTVWLHGFAITLHRSEAGSLNALCLVERTRADWARRLLGHDAQVLSAISEIRGALLRGDGIDDVLTLVCDSTRELMNADATGLLEVEGGQVRLRAAHTGAAGPIGMSWALVDDELGVAVREHRLMTATIGPETVASSAGREASPEVYGDRVHMALSPVTGPDGNVGVLGVRRSDSPFGDADLTVLEAFSLGVGETFAVAAGRAELERLRVLEVRQSIARDLHDEVIQDLIGVRLQLDGLVSRAQDAELAGGLEDVRDELNRTTIRLRDVVAGLQEEPVERFEDAVRALTGSRAQRQGLDWSVVITGPVDTLAGGVRADVLRVLNESVSNVLRHAAASRVDVCLTAGDGRVQLTVTDDGIGPQEVHGSAGMGLENLRMRASDRGGECSLAPGPAGGSVLAWSVPTGAADPAAGSPLPAS
jgi:signal transduction histidine kinase